MRVNIPGDFRLAAGQVISLNVIGGKGDLPPDISVFAFHMKPKKGGRTQPIMMATVPPALASALSAIIANWALADRVFTEMTLLLLSYNDRNLAGWREQDTKRRLRLHSEIFTEIFAGYRDLLAHHHREIMSRAWTVKRIRDLIGHAQIASTRNRAGEVALRFKSSKLEGNRPRIFTAPQLEALSWKAASVAGDLNALVEYPELVPVSQRSKLALWRVLDKNRWSAAMSAALDFEHSELARKD